MNGKATRMLFAAVGLSAFAAVLASTANARIPEGDVVKVVTAQSPQLQRAAPESAFGVPAEIYAASTSPTVVSDQQTPQASGTFGVDPEIYATLDPAIQFAIQSRSHVSPLATKAVGAGTRQKQVTRALPYLSYLGNRSQVAGGQARPEKKALLPHGIQVGLP